MKPLKILHCANFSDLKNAAVFYSIDHKLTHGLARNGHFIYNFSYRDIAKVERRFFSKEIGRHNMLRRLEECLNNLQPDLLLLGHSELITTADLILLRNQFPNIKIAMWWVDWIHNLTKHKSKLEVVDHFFMTTHPSELSRLGISAATIEKCSYMPNVCDSAIDHHRAYNNPTPQYDIIFVGRYDKDRAPLVEHLQRHYHQYNLGIFGQTRDSLVFGERYYKILATSKIAINFSRSNEFNLYSSDRLIQPIANGVLTLSAHFPGIEEIFTPDQVPTFDNFDSLDNLLTLYLGDDIGRRTTAEAACKYAHQFYDAQRVTKAMLTKIFSEQSH